MPAAAALPEALARAASSSVGLQRHEYMCRDLNGRTLSVVARAAPPQPNHYPTIGAAVQPAPLHPDRSRGLSLAVVQAWSSPAAAASAPAAEHTNGVETHTPPPANQMPRPTPTRPDAAALLAAFRELDASGDGLIARAKFVDVLSRPLPGRPTPLTLSEAEMLFRQVDAVGNGSVDYEGCAPAEPPPHGPPFPGVCVVGATALLGRSRQVLHRIQLGEPHQGL